MISALRSAAACLRKLSVEQSASSAASKRPHTSLTAHPPPLQHPGVCASLRSCDQRREPFSLSYARCLHSTSPGVAVPLQNQTGTNRVESQHGQVGIAQSCSPNRASCGSTVSLAHRPWAGADAPYCRWVFHMQAGACFYGCLQQACCNPSAPGGASAAGIIIARGVNKQHEHHPQHTPSH